MKMEFVENEPTSTSGGSVSGSGDGGSGSGRGANGSDSGNSRDVIGNSGDVSGNSGNVSGSADTGSADTDSGSDSARRNESDISANVESANGNSGTVNRPSRVERQRNGRVIRLGDFGNRDSDTGSADSRTDTIGRDDVNNNEPVSRVVLGQGRRTQGNPRTVKNVDVEAPVKLGQIKDYVSVFLQSVFDIPAIALGQDFWKLSKEENKQLTDAIVAYLESLPKSQGSKIAQFVQNHFPLLNLAMVALFVCSERVQKSVNIAKANKVMQTMNAPNFSTNNEFVDASAQNLKNAFSGVH
jgi:hypothetical protein